MFASWCDPCKREMPELVKYAKKRKWCRVSWFKR
ncbi:hypothetical protein [Mammaliicoccus vitulinus]|nr:hypothetical protein [Mammaliicoccus vitulinus]